MRVHVNTSGLKPGDVIESDRRYAVVTSVYRNLSGMPEVAVLYTDGSTSAWTEEPLAVSGFRLRVGAGCEPNLQALRKFVEALNYSFQNTEHPEYSDFKDLN